MLDPFPIAPPAFLVSATKPFADALNLHTLPLHIHEVLFAAAFYFFTCGVLSPYLSSAAFPKIYPRLSRRGRLNWDVHVTSFVQACIINTVSLYIIWYDEERMAWRPTAEWKDRIWSYYGSGGMCQSFALGYFLWDLVMCSTYVDIFGWGMLAHACSAVAVFGLGYRPFIYFSAPIFLLYELSSPFLNIHWFCDKLNLTGSIYQAINGAFLVGTFFCCRIVFGLYSSVWVFRDMYWVIRDGHTDYQARVGDKIQTLSVEQMLAVSRDPQAQLRAFNTELYIPIWIPAIYLLSNLILNSLNVFWFHKMIETIRTRFDPPWGTKGIQSSKAYTTQNSEEEESPEPEDSDLGVGGPGKRRDSEHVHPEADGVAAKGKGKGSVKAARKRAEEAMNGPVGTVEDTRMERSVHADGGESVEVTGSTRKSARSRRKA